MKYHIIHFTIFLCSLITSYGQSGSVSGVVKDDEGNPLADVNIFIPKINKGTFTDQLGKFIITGIHEGAYLATVSSIGYAPDSVVIEIKENETTIKTFTLQEHDLLLSDLVVTDHFQQTVNTISQVDIKLRPTNTSQDILRMVPGLFIAQHAGGGKAEQIFLRGFDIDHGTDINLEVDGMPVNMVSHAHGQGYSDLHFLIPELVSFVDFNKGPYYADKGNFTTAGYASFHTRNSLDKNQVKIEGGQYGTVRNVNALRLLNTQTETRKTDAYIASEFFRSDGYFKSNQNFNRINISGRFNSYVNNNQLFTLGVSTFKSSWTASGQIPERAVRNGVITRFGAIDDTEGGETSRTNVFIKHVKELEKGSLVENQLYYTKYDFNLASNFTFFLNDAVNGDQITQSESRNLYGYRGKLTHTTPIGNTTLMHEAGIGIRNDDVNDIHLARTKSRKQVLESKARGDINETNMYAYISETLQFNPRFSVNAAIRLDHFSFNYIDALAPVYVNLHKTKSIVSPKFNVNYSVNQSINLYVKSGIGFHSNDTRVVAQNNHDILPKAYGIDIGGTFKITEQLLVNLALWSLDLEQEFVYVGDEGIVEPSGKTSRRGIDLSFRYQLLKGLYLDSDVNFTKPVMEDEPEGQNYIPLAPTFSSMGGLTFRLPHNFNGSLRYRYLHNRPANEDNSLIAEGYFLADAVIRYTRPVFEISVSAENIFNTAWKEAQFETESRLYNEPHAVSEIHFTPGTPFFLKAGVSLFF